MSYADIIAKLTPFEKATIAASLTQAVMEHSPKMDGKFSDEAFLRFSITNTCGVFADILTQLEQGSNLGWIPSSLEIREQLRDMGEISQPF